jgi:cellulose synthase/poly-beta-1,6-N-acetylglucosamine synthase-like glycosyltransferase
MSCVEPTVSVVIPAYNCAAKIEAAIQSVQQQIFAPTEIMVVDDGSTDETLAVLRRLAEQVETLRFVSQENGGPAKARNTGINLAKGEWIAFLDADDQWLPNRLQSQLNLLREHPHLNWMAGGFDSRRSGESPNRDNRVKPLLSETRDSESVVIDALEALAGAEILWTGTILVRRDFIIKVGGFNTALKGPEDSELWVRLAIECREIGFVREPIAVYTTAQEDSLMGQSSRGISSAQLEHYRILEKHRESAADRDVKNAIARIIAYKTDGYARGLIRTGNTHLAREFCRQLTTANFPQPGIVTRLMMRVPGSVVSLLRKVKHIYT